MARQSGNIMIYILGAIVLIGLLMVLVKGSFQEGTGIDGEQLLLRANQLQQYAGEIERGVSYILREGVSETEIRFAAPNASSAYGSYSDTPAMVFAPAGGAVEYKNPPAGINDGSPLGFFATTHLTGLGTNSGSQIKAELLAVLPNVTQGFCNQINRSIKQSIDLSQVTDPGANGCVYAPGSEFTGTFSSGASTNTLDNDQLSRTPATEACVRCSDGTFHYYKVLLSR